MKCLTKFLDSSPLTSFSLVIWSKNSQVNGVVGTINAQIRCIWLLHSSGQSKVHGTFDPDLSKLMETSIWFIREPAWDSVEGLE